MHHFQLPLADIQAAYQRIRPYVRQTPFLTVPIQPATQQPRSLSLGLKLENLQVTGSFKARGAFNNLLQLTPAQRQRGIIAASGGNHGLALAYAAQQLAIPATIYLPVTTGDEQRQRIAALGPTIVQVGENWSNSHQQALVHAEAEGLTYIHAFDALRTLAGQGTLGLELLAEVPDMDLVLIAIGGGGLIGGMAAAIKQQRPTVRIVGVEPTGAASMLHSLQAGKVAPLAGVQTIAVTLAPNAPSESTLALTQRYVDELVTIDDDQMVTAMRWLWQATNQLVEPAGAAVIAAILTGVVDLQAAQRPVALICGGNAAVNDVFHRYQRDG